MQRLRIVRKGQQWYIRYYTPELLNGKRKEKWEAVAPVDERYRTEQDVESLARQKFNDVVAKIADVPEAAQRLTAYIEFTYLPAMEAVNPKTGNALIRASTLNGYKHIYNKHVKHRLVRDFDFRLFDFNSAAAGRRLLLEIASETELSKSSIKHIKHFFAAVIKYAINNGDLNGPNLIREIDLKSIDAKEGEDTYAYNLDEIAHMMKLLPEPARTVVGVAAFTGLRRSELRGLKWEDWVDTPGPGPITPTSLYVRRTVWNTVIEEKTKTKASKDLVPAVKGTKACPLVHELLEAHRNGHAPDGYVFAGEKFGRPLNLANLARRVIVPTLESAREAHETDVEWHGWHAFRRGLATNLDELGVDHKVIAAILRHANEKVTEAFYIKMRRPKPVAQKALKQLGKAFAVAVKNARTEARRHST